MTWEIYLAYLATIAVFFATPPGPSQVLMIANSAAHGVRRAGYTVAGDLSANALQMTAAAFGLAAVIAASDVALSVVKWAGVAYLAFLGLKMLLSRGGPQAASAAAAPTPMALFRQGFVTSATNPKAVVFFAALFPQFITAGAPVGEQLLILGATYLVVDGVLLFVWGALAERALSRLGRGGGLLNRISGGLMLAAAALLAAKDLDLRPGRS